MIDGAFVADFVANNLEKIYSIGLKAYGKADETLQVKFKTAYTNYLTVTRDKYSKSKSFFIRNQAVDLYSYYVSTGIACGDVTLESPTFESCLDQSNRIVVTGTGGSGKSVLIRHLFLDCIRHKSFTPILIELRDLNGSKLTLDEHIESVLDTYGFDVSGDYILRAKQAGHFCFFLDGYDEIDHANRKLIIKQVRALSNKFQKCPVIISSRPDETFNGIDEYSLFKILPLDINSASSLISKLPFEPDIKEKFVRALNDGLFKEHESFLSNPLLLSIMLLTYGENAEIPSKLSIFYNQAYEALFQRHDANKGGYSRNRLTNLDIQDFSRVFSLFALQTYERRIFKMPLTDCLSYIEKSRANLHLNFKAEDYLDDLMSAACLLIEEGLEVTFSHRSFQEYFVALYISMASPDVQQNLISRYCENISQDNVISLLLEINPELVERLVLVPKLEEIFEALGVKRKVGVQHTFKHLKTNYDTLILSRGKLHCSRGPRNKNTSSIVYLAARHCGTYEYPESSYFNEFYEALKSKHSAGLAKRWKLSEQSYRSTIIVDVVGGKGAFSQAALQGAFEAYKFLKAKHQNRSQDLQDLLGF